MQRLGLTPTESASWRNTLRTFGSSTTSPRFRSTTSGTDIVGSQASRSDKVYVVQTEHAR